ncbi:serine-rich adhesin for platelets-like isoform X2 [Neocloeon triangulifer]|uniref:serine-rich adhesin for platelets-like isoform X2 n=1 Tax=Neocloeon triangulifer TaxID=2078957 RepID=UPI00286F9406|nr:serine-rich adhesin for platelets-like isoform X2 [Neocloeon triangulifer]
MRPQKTLFIICLGAFLAVIFYNGESAGQKLGRVNTKGNHLVIQVNKPGRYSIKTNAENFKGKQRRAMIVKCCSNLKCTRTSEFNQRKNNTSARVAKIIRNELNGPSNRFVVIGRKKYKFPSEMASFEEAKKICEDQGLDLTSPASTKESKSIDEYLNYIGLGSEPLFTAFPTDDSLSGAKWGSEKPPGGPGECLTQYKGSLYNASCNQQSHFSCQEKPLPDGVTQSYDMLASIGDAVLNFVGGKNIIAPSERASVPEATGMCKEKGMDLMSLDSLTQLSSVQDFLGGIGLSSSTLLTSMKKVDDSGSSNWLGDLASALLPPPKNPADQGDCMGISSLGILGVSCDMVSNFVCQAPPPKLIADNGNELPFSMDLLNMANSLGIDTILETATSEQTKSITTSKKATTQVRVIKTTLLKPSGNTLMTATSLITIPDIHVTDGTVIVILTTTPYQAQADITVAKEETTPSPVTAAPVITTTTSAPINESTSTDSTTIQMTSTSSTSTTTLTTSTTTITTTTTSTTTTTTTPCPANFNISKVYTTWESARLDCNRNGMDLITIDSQLKENCFAAYLQNQSRVQNTFWIGISSITQSTFTWANDNSSLSYVQWQNGFPTSNKKEACVSSSGGQWKNQMCTDINFYACEQSKNIINTTLKGCPATSSRYTLTRDKKSWAAARVECGKDGMDLVSSETPEEDACVRSLINKTGLEPEFVWMSLNCINETFYNHWVNGVNVSFKSWGPQQPSEYPAEKCAIYWKNAWYDLPCDYETYYVCEGSTN